MKVAIIGYGKMGHEIEKVLLERGHDVVAKIDVDNRAEIMTPEVLSKVDVAIEFTSPTTAYDNIKACIEAGVAVLSGSTGWTERKTELDELCRHKGGAFSTLQTTRWV